MRWVGLLASSISILSLTSPCSAQTPEEAKPAEVNEAAAAVAPSDASTSQLETTPQEYLDEVAAGSAEYDAGSFKEALVHFQRAHAIMPNARSFWALGQTAYETGDYADCVHHLEAALSDTRRPLSAQQRKEAEQTLAKARDYVSSYQLRLAPPNAKLRLDDRPVTLNPDRSLLLGLGRHVLELSAPAYDAEKREIHVFEPGQGGVITMQLRPTAVDRPGFWDSPWPWILGGVLVVGAATAATLVAINAAPKDERPQTGTSGLLITVPSGGSSK